MPMTIKRIILSIFLSLFVINLSAQSSSGIPLRRVVIDPGHGGKDPGALSPDKKLREKDITLYVSKKFGELINKKYPDVEVYYTRTSDVHVPLDKRSAFANDLNADIFISIHVNAAKSRNAKGVETFVMGMHKSESNLEVCLLENSVITLEDDYHTTYQNFDPNNPESYIIFSLVQSASLEQSMILADYTQKHLKNGPIKGDRGIKQGGLVVLWRATMPAILVELGFISNSEDRKILATTSGKDKMAEQLFKAFEDFKRQYEAGMSVSGSSPIQVSQPDKPTTKVAEADVKKVVEDVKKGESSKSSVDDEKKSDLKSGKEYRIQVFAVNSKLSKNDYRFKKEKNINYILEGKTYKYSVGAYQTLSQAKKDLPRVKKKFDGAFIIVVEDEKIVQKIF